MGSWCMAAAWRASRRVCPETPSGPRATFSRDSAHQNWSSSEWGTTQIDRVDDDEDITRARKYDQVWRKWRGQAGLAKAAQCMPPTKVVDRAAS